MTKIHEESLDAFMAAHGTYEECVWAGRHPEMPPSNRLHAQVDRNDYYTAVWVEMVGWGTVLHFQLKNYPHCCAMTIFENFDVAPWVKQEWLDAFLETVLTSKLFADTWSKNRRLLVAMVQVDHPEYAKCQDITDVDAWVLKEHVPTLNPQIQYPQFYEFFKKQKVCRTSLLPNRNSGYMINLLEVILNK